MYYTIVHDIRHFGTPTASVKSGEGNMKRYTKNEILEILESTDKERILSYRTDRERVLANPILKDRLADILGHSNINTTRIYIITTGAEHQRRLENMRLII